VIGFVEDARLLGLAPNDATAFMFAPVVLLGIAVLASLALLRAPKYREPAPSSNWSPAWRLRRS
jgi:hypothetical protein